VKQVKITLRQDGQSFVVTRFSNTVQLSIGMRIDAKTVENWCIMPRVQVDVVGMVETEENDTPLLDEPRQVETVTAATEFDAESGGGIQERAREFDSIMFELAPIVGWANDGLLAIATAPSAGGDNLGTLGIKGNIERGNALAKIRRNAAKELGIDADEVGKVSCRAANLGLIKSFLKQYNEQPF
jgi:hypothetical protein